MISLIRRAATLVGDWIAPNLKTFLETRQPVVWLMAIAVGIAAAIGAILFRLGIAIVQLPWLGTMTFEGRKRDAPKRVAGPPSAGRRRILPWRS